MIVIDTDLLKQMAHAAQGANDTISEAADLLNQIAVHNNWSCRERNEINELTQQNKNRMKRLQEAGNSFYHTIQQVSSEMETVEREFPAMFEQVEDILSGMLSIPVHSVTSSKKMVQTAKNAIAGGSSRTDVSSGWAGLAERITTGIRVADFCSLDLSGGQKS